MWWGADTGTNVFFFMAADESAAMVIAQRDFGSSKLAGSLPLVLGEFKGGNA